MGSFSLTCAVSGFPIHVGDPVRALLLCSGPYAHEERPVYIDDSYVPRTWPLRARYNDYGSIEDVEEGPQRDVWLSVLDRDLVEVGVGDNSCHDVAVRRGMTFEALLDGVQEGRVAVQREKYGSERATPEQHEASCAELGQPTLRSVEALLPAVMWKGRYLVDEIHDGARVRWDGSGDDFRNREPLRAAQSALSERFACVLTAGSGSYADAEELRVFMAPGKRADGHDRRIYTRETSPALPLDLCCIREDVYSGLIGIPVEGDYDFKRRRYAHNAVSVHVEQARAGLRLFRERWRARRDGPRGETPRRLVDTLAWEAEEAFERESQARRAFRREDLGTSFLTQDRKPFLIGLATHAWALACDDAVSDEQLDAFATVVGEFTHLNRVMARLRIPWRPAWPIGPQCSEWRDHVRLVQVLGRVARAAAKEQREERAKWS